MKNLPIGILIFMGLVLNAVTFADSMKIQQTPLTNKSSADKLSAVLPPVIIKLGSISIPPQEARSFSLSSLSLEHRYAIHCIIKNPDYKNQFNPVYMSVNTPPRVTVIVNGMPTTASNFNFVLKNQYNSFSAYPIYTDLLTKLTFSNLNKETVIKVGVHGGCFARCMDEPCLENK